MNAVEAPTQPRYVPVQESNSRQFDPVTGYKRKPRGRVPWAVHCRAWECYAKHHGGWGQDAETIAQRGGFSYRELQVFLAGLNRRSMNSRKVCSPEMRVSPRSSMRRSTSEKYAELAEKRECSAAYCDSIWPARRVRRSSR